MLSKLFSCAVCLCFRIARDNHSDQYFDSKFYRILLLSLGPNHSCFHVLILCRLP
uniref:Uncharacterized protein n=1 Tax=Rhizophora mucronata TaxID=61149 RepID=A0A2P2JG49_RHIMU